MTENGKKEKNGKADGYREGGAAPAASPSLSAASGAEADMDIVARQAARLKITEECPVEILPHGSRLYFVAKGWETSIIEKDPNVRVVETLSAFEEALRDPGAETVFIPEGARVTLPQLVRISRRNAAEKVIYKEENKGEQSDA